MSEQDAEGKRAQGKRGTATKRPREMLTQHSSAEKPDSGKCAWKEREKARREREEEEEKEKEEETVCGPETRWLKGSRRRIESVKCNGNIDKSQTITSLHCYVSVGKVGRIEYRTGFPPAHMKAHIAAFWAWSDSIFEAQHSERRAKSSAYTLEIAALAMRIKLR